MALIINRDNYNRTASMSKPFRPRKLHYLTDNDSPPEQQPDPSAKAEMERRLRRAQRMNNPLIVRNFKRKFEKSLCFLTDCGESSSSECSSNEQVDRHGNKRTGPPIHYTWDYVRKMIKRNDESKTQGMDQTISQAKSFIQQIRQNLQGNKQ